MNVTWPGWSIGVILALLVLVACFVLALVHQMEPRLALMIGALALSRLT